MSDATLQHEQLKGSIERVTFHSEDTGFCVLRVWVRGHRDLITVIGHAASIAVGEYIVCEGLWITDRQHGVQFKAKQLQVILPTTLDGIEKYLGSGMVKGIGPHFAKKLVKAFGEQVFDVIEQTPERLLALPGIGEKRKAQVTAAWSEQKAIREIMVFLQSYGVGTARAVRIYKTYGDDAITTVTENPYRLALDIRGIGFKTADQLASALGISSQSPLRAQAGVHHVLQTMCDQGHCAAAVPALIESAHALLEIPADVLEAAIAQQVEDKHIVIDEIDGQSCAYLSALHHSECHAAEHLHRLNRGPVPWGEIDAAKAIAWIEKKTGLQLAASQQQALLTTLRAKLSIITGGPGVGKTTIVTGLIGVLRAKKMRVSLCAPTGRAAKRLAEVTGCEATTIHRLLDFDPKTFKFKHDQSYPLVTDVVLVDESSMIDVVLFNHLLKAIPQHAAVIFVGDVDQLPSVGPGAVLSDLIDSGVIETARLTDIFRQAADSDIITNAHRVNAGYMPESRGGGDQRDFFTLYTDTPEVAYDTLIDLVAERLPRYYRCNPLKDIQVLTPMNRGGLGARALNSGLQAALNPQQAGAPSVSRFGSTYAVGDKVIQMTNNYDKAVFNGDLGWITAIDLDVSEVTITFDGQAHPYAFHELDEIQLAYAISIHKSQGSEFPMVVIPVVMQHYTLLARNLLYTGITRGKQRVILLGQKKAVGMAVRNHNQQRRLTALSQRLEAGF